MYFVSKGFHPNVTQDHVERRRFLESRTPKAFERAITELLCRAHIRVCKQWLSQTLLHLQLENKPRER